MLRIIETEEIIKKSWRVCVGRSGGTSNGHWWRRETKLVGNKRKHVDSGDIPIHVERRPELWKAGTMLATVVV